MFRRSSKREERNPERKIEALDEMGAIVERVQSHFHKLSLMIVEKQSDQQKLWLLAYSAVNAKFAPGTEAAMMEAALLLPILDRTIEP
jgi:hypothetical protein